MLLNYTTQQPKRLSFPGNRLAAAVVFACLLQSAFGQAPADYASLLNQRNERISQSLDTREIDRQLYAVGYRPKAVTQTETLENGQTRVTFLTYHPLSEAKKTQAEQRLGAHYGSYLLAITVDVSQQQVMLLLAPGTTSEQLDAIVEHFGYLGHE